MSKCKKKYRVGLADADLLDGGTRHPNLVLLKLAGFLRDNDVDVELICDPKCDISAYDRVYVSRVFTFTALPEFCTKFAGEVGRKIHIGGTGQYANEADIKTYRRLRQEDMTALERDGFLNKLSHTTADGPVRGIDMATQMPYYDLYRPYIEQQVRSGADESKYKDYLRYSIGFLTRGCYRHCPFCINKLENAILPYSLLETFHDKSRPHVYFWDDNFLAAPYEVWHSALEELIEHKISFQFRQGLDERQLAENPHGEEMAQMLSKARYHGDYIFAFDNWRDREVVEKALKVWKKYNPTKGTKFYLFCGYRQAADRQKQFYDDVRILFLRIKILMSYGCVGYVMRHEDYHKAPIPNIYVQIARWCNQQQFYKKMSFWQFVYRNQTYYEEKELGFPTGRPLKTFAEFEAEVAEGYYTRVKMCRPLRTVLETLAMFPDKKEELIEMFNYRMDELVDPTLWTDADKKVKI